MSWNTKEKSLAVLSTAVPLMSGFLPTAAAACKGQCAACGGGCLSLIVGSIIAGTALFSYHPSHTSSGDDLRKPEAKPLED